jgi:hypothetical protein
MLEPVVDEQVITEENTNVKKYKAFPDLEGSEGGDGNGDIKDGG